MGVKYFFGYMVICVIRICSYFNANELIPIRLRVPAYLEDYLLTLYITYRAERSLYITCRVKDPCIE